MRRIRRQNAPWRCEQCGNTYDAGDPALIARGRLYCSTACEHGARPYDRPRRRRRWTDRRRPLLPA